MKATITVIAVIFIYIAFATFFQNTAIVGELGRTIGQGHFYLLGYIAYMDMFILLYPLYQLYRVDALRVNLDFYLGWTLLFISLILVQSIFLNETNMGLLGIKVMRSLEPIIGLLGVIFFTLMVLSLAIIFLLDDDVRFSKSYLDKQIEEGSFFTNIKNLFDTASFEEEELADLGEPLNKNRITTKEDKNSEEESRLAQRKKEELKAFISKPKEKSTEENLSEKEDAVVNEILEIEQKMEEATTPKTLLNEEFVTKKPIKIIGEREVFEEVKEKTITPIVSHKKQESQTELSHRPKEEMFVVKKEIIKPKSVETQDSFINTIKEEKLPHKNTSDIEKSEEAFIDKIKEETLSQKKEIKEVKKENETKTFIHKIKEETLSYPLKKEKEEKPILEVKEDILEEDTPLINQIMQEELAKEKVHHQINEKEEKFTLDDISFEEGVEVLSAEGENKRPQETRLVKKIEENKPKKIEDTFVEEENSQTKVIQNEISLEEEKDRREKIAKELIIKNDFNKSMKENIKEVEVEEKAKIEESVTHSAIVKELDENSKLMEMIEKGEIVQPSNFELPPLDFLQEAPEFRRKINEEEIDKNIEELLSKLQQFRVNGDVVRCYSGPLVTTFEFKPAANVKISKILGLQDDLAMALRAETIRIQAPIPGKDVVGIEIPNSEIDTIYLRELLESDVFQKSASTLTVALGKDIVGEPFFTDIRKLPHLLIAGTTGSGKSVGINAMILSLLYRNDPDTLKLMLIDPKMLEFAMYEDIPHLITPVITEPMKAIAALANMVAEMERRYKLMAQSRTKTIEKYNEKVTLEQSAEKFPFIVVVIDELADLMMSGGKDAENSIARLAQKSRACGIHLIVATQRPSVDVVTGMIKANLPSRLSYRVGQRIDSKVILDAMGAESLLGRGDGLFTPPGTTGLVRIHAPWNAEDEIDKIVHFLKQQRKPEYDESYLIAGGSSGIKGEDEPNITLDALYEDAKAIVLSDKKTSISYLQRKLQIGYNRSANIIDQLEQMGVLSPVNAKGNREIVG